MRKDLVDFLRDNIEFNLDFDKLLEKPKLDSHGDFSFPCFLLAKELKLAPPQIAKNLEEEFNLDKPNFISKIQAVGPFLNFYLNSDLESKQVIESILSGDLFNFELNQKEKIVIEYPSPNTNKSLHVGHTRNMLLGSALSLILKKVGHEVLRVNLNNDRGIAVCKTMLSYQLFGEGSTPESMNMKEDDFVSFWYVKYGEVNKEKPELELDKKAQDMLVKWEAGESQVLNLWNKILTWVYAGYKKTFEYYKLEKFDDEFFESKIYDKGKDIVLNALNNNLDGFKQEEDGAVYVDLEDKGFGKKYLLRGDLTTLYMTQDIYLADLKHKKFNADKYIFVVGQEQEYHFNVLFEVLEKLGLGGGNKNFHFSYGYVYDENGNKFSSRLGNTIGADQVYLDILDEARKNLLEKELTKNLQKQELERRAEIIAFSALAFTFLKPNPLSSINFSMKQALSFEGETGPYCLYSYARIQSVLKKANFDISLFNVKNLDYALLNEKEIQLIKILKEFNEVVLDSANKYKVSNIANFAIKASQAFNDFYQNSPILKVEDENVKNLRLILAYSTSLVLKESLALLNIEVLEEM